MTTPAGTFRVERSTHIDAAPANMDKLVGKDFEAGLANLNAQAERAPAQA